MDGVVGTYSHAQLDDPGTLGLLVETAVLDLGVGLRLVERNQRHGGGGGGGVVVDASDLAGADVGDRHAEGDSSERGRRHCRVQIKEKGRSRQVWCR